MADNLGNNNNIFVNFDCQNIILVDPNKTQNDNGTVSERKLAHEDLVMYANLEARVIPRTKLAVGAPISDAIRNVPLATMNFLRPGGRTQLRNDYLDEITGLNSQSGKGTNQPSKTSVQQENKTNEFYVNQNVINPLDTGLLGIESIRITNTRSATPTVEMVLIDTQGRALFEKGENSEYAAFFNLPYPIFFLTLKGYYGKAIRYQLILTNFSAAFEGNTGNYRINLTFYSYKYTILAETQVGSLFALPYMYSSDFRVQSTGQEPPAVQAARASLGNDRTNTQVIRSTKGYSAIKNMFAKYKALGLISKDLPELSFPELMARLELLERNIIQGFGQADFSPLSDIQNYNKLLTDLYNDVYSSNENSWFSRYIDRDNVFVYKSRVEDTPPNEEPEELFVYVFKNSISANEQTTLDAYTQLKQLVDSYKTALGKNPTLGLNGSFTVDGRKDDSTKISGINKIFVNNPSNSVDQNNALIEDTFRKALSPNDIDWEATYVARNKREGTPLEVLQLKTQFSGLFRPTQTNIGEDIVMFPTYSFVFDGKNNFNGIIQQITNDVNKQKEKVVLALGAFLERKIEGPNGLGFRPSLRNIMAMIFASIEGFYLLLDDVHTDAWSQRLNKKRRKAIFDPVTSSASPDTAQLNPKTTTPNLSNTPVYPWPQYLVNTNAQDDEPFEIRYPGEPSQVSRTGANDYVAWPEVEFVEEYIKGLAKTLDAPPSPNGNANLSRTINRLSVNAVEFPMTNFPYSDYQSVKFLYEIYERVLLAAYWDRLSKGNKDNFEIYKTLSDIENVNIQTALLGASPQLTKILKNIALSPVNYLEVLRNSSNDGTGPSWQQLIRGLFTSEYLRVITTKDYGILPNTTFSNGSDSTTQDVDSLSKVQQFIKSTKSNQTDIADLYPFVDNNWTQYNLSTFTTSENTYLTTKSLYVNESKKFITNFQDGLNQNENRPFTSGEFLTVNLPELENSNGLSKNFNTFYLERTISGNYLVTEGPINYQNKTGKLDADQTTSMMNTPVFVNAIDEAVARQKNGDANAYILPAYLFLNSLPLSTLREKYKNVTPTQNTDLDYIFATMTKFGGIHKVPYAWVLKYGAIWHRYKTWAETNTDILNPIWNNVNYVDLYDPITGNLQKNYDFQNQVNKNISIVGQNNLTVPGVTNSIMNVGFYPKMINNYYYIFTGQDLFTTYSNAEIQSAITEGLNVGSIPKSSIELPIGFDNQDPNRLLTYKTWYVSFDSKNSAKFSRLTQNQTVVIPSFGNNSNQVLEECFVPSPTGRTLSQEVFNNTAIYDGSARSFWAAPNYGYFELPSITKPNVDEYFKEILPNTQNTDPFQLQNQYSNIEEIFGVLKKEILDEFETEFLNFCVPQTNANLDFSVLVNKNFQTLFQELMSIDVIDNKLTVEDYVRKVGVGQAEKMTNTIRTFLNYDVALKIGNPSNFNRRLWGSFTTNPSNKVFDGFTWDAYVNGSLPTSTGTTTLVLSIANNLAAWRNMYTYVGFATEPGLVYSDNGSYYTDFFVDLNIQFNETNVANFAPLIKIYGTQKLLANGAYNSQNFTQDINEYYNDNDQFVSEILTQLFFSLQKQLPNVEQSNEKPILSGLDGNQQKIDLWETFKAFNDKWIAGGEFRERTLFQDVLFLDRANRDIGDTVLMDVIKLKQFLSGSTVTNARVIDFVSKIFVDNKFQMMPMPAYINFWGVGEVINGQRPRTETSQDMANSLFGTFLDVDYRDSSPKLVCYYVGKPSEHLNFSANESYRWKSDSFDFDCGANQPLNAEISEKTDFANSNKVVGFNVDFGTRNQGIFYSIQLDQKGAAATSEANRVITDIALQAGGKRATSQSVSLYNYYKVRSYECRVESLGNVMIQPTMYFNLQHVPMFYGPYMVQSVEHHIQAGDFKTYFTGVRIPVGSIPKITQQLVSLNENLLSELVQQVQRLKETDAQTVTNNVISVGNSIRSNQVFAAASPARCVADMQVANVRYRNYQGIETTKREITFSELSSKIKTRISDNVLRGIVFFTAYLNGHDDNKFITWDYDLGGTPFGGTIYSGISYSERRVFFNPEYGCRTTSNGISVPYAVFESFEKSIDFINEYFKTLYNNTSSVSQVRLNWSTKADYIASLVTLWTEWWPTKKFQTTEQYVNWLNSNAEVYRNLGKQAEEAVEKAISLGLINF